MSNSALTKDLKAFVLSMGFDDVKIADAKQETPYKTEFQRAIVENRHGPLDYLERTAKERADVLALMPEAQSVVVVAKNYFTGDHEKKAEKTAKVSRYAWGGDYHHWFKKRLRKIRKEIETRHGAEVKVHIFNDTGPVLERGWAERSGLGFIGKSGMLIHRELGTWTFLGGFVTSLKLVADKPSVRQMCGSCTACIDACPTGAIVAPQKIDARLCLTTWNVERPLLKEADQDHLKGHGWAVGCDICQRVCPWNKFEHKTEESRFFPRLGHDQLVKGQKLQNIQGTPIARTGLKGLELSIDRALFKKY